MENIRTPTSVRTASGRTIRETLVVVRGGGDLATGVVSRLHTAGFGVVVTELAAPLTVRRTVSLSTAVHDGKVDVESLRGRLVTTGDDARAAATAGEIPVLVCPGLPPVHADVIVDARLAKRNIDTTINDAEFVVALGPGFEAGRDCHAIVETIRGHSLGRVLWRGTAIPNTGVPGELGGQSTKRVLRAPNAGTVQWLVAIGDLVQESQALGVIDNAVVKSPFTGVVRGLIHPATMVPAGAKIGDVDPRIDPTHRNDVHTISDKALAIGGGVLEAVLVWMRGQPTR